MVSLGSGIPWFSEENKPTHRIFFNKALQSRVFTTITLSLEGKYTLLTLKWFCWLCVALLPDLLMLYTKAPLLGRMLVQPVEAGRKQTEGACTRKVSLDTEKSSIGGLGGGVMTTIIGLGVYEFGHSSTTTGLSDPDAPCRHQKCFQPPRKAARIEPRPPWP